MGLTRTTTPRMPRAVPIIWRADGRSPPNSTAAGVTHSGVAGERYYVHIRDVLRLLDAANEEVSDSSVGVRGLVKINAPAAFGRLHLGGIMTRLQDIYPELAVELNLNDEFIDPVNEGVDIVFRIGELEDSGLIGRTLCEQQYLLCASPRYLEKRGSPIEPEGLLQHDCLIHLGNLSSEPWHFNRVGEVAKTKIYVSGPWRSNDSEVLLNAAIAGKGIGLFPSWLLNETRSSEIH